MRWRVPPRRRPSSDPNEREGCGFAAALAHSHNNRHPAVTVTLESTALAADARAALRMIREVVEQKAPPGSVPSEVYVEPPFTKEAEALVRGILAIVEANG